MAAEPFLIEVPSDVVQCLNRKAVDFALAGGLAYSAPVITSNTTSLPEVAGDAAILVNPLNARELGEAMVRVLSDKKLREALRTKGFRRAKQYTWERAARRTLEVYQEVCSMNRA